MDFADGAYIGDMSADMQRLVNYLGGQIGDVPLLAEPRITAVVAAAYIERYLSELIEQHMPQLTDELKKRLFEPGQALGNITAKNDLALALAATDNLMWSNIRFIMQIRNKFAHDLRVDDFDHPAVLKQVDKLVLKQTYVGVAQETIDKLEAAFARCNRGQRFRDIALHVAINLSNAVTANRKKIAARATREKP
jgi:DNA-binding MltR family transcriptional regulator